MRYNAMPEVLVACGQADDRKSEDRDESDAAQLIPFLFGRRLHLSAERAYMRVVRHFSFAKIAFLHGDKLPHAYDRHTVLRNPGEPWIGSVFGTGRLSIRSC
jgi:hypothetical protein